MINHVALLNLWLSSLLYHPLSCEVQLELLASIYVYSSVCAETYYTY